MTTAMTHGPTVLREVDPAERYYWLLDQLAPMNIAAIAELDRRLDPSEVAAALAAVQRQHPFLRARIEVVDDQLSVVEAAGEIVLSVTSVADVEGSGSGSGWLAEVEAELDRPFAPAPSPLARCLYCPVDGIDGEERSVLVVVVHHALADGRAAVAALQHVLRRIEEGGQWTSSPVTADLPPALHERFPAEFRSAKGALGVLGAVREERDGQDSAASFPFHAREVAGQVSRLDRLIVQPEAARAMHDQARSADATINGVLAAAVLESTAALFEPSGDRMLNLATPTDLRQRVEPPLPADGVFMAIGLLCTPYLVSSTDSGSGTGTGMRPGNGSGMGNPELARRITEQTRREVERGESHLFYRFARAGSFAATEDGITSFADWMAATAHNVAVSNLGVVDDQGDPAWVQSISFALSTSANQPAFVAVCTYRDQLVLNLATDRTKLPADFASRLVEGIGQRIGAAAGG
ncbi:MAG TPA: hypothetical protein VG298_17180 [Acidimicrobiales bacterium]|nr:hypothetical protein [Acidimicrobiales bacterium]